MTFRIRHEWWDGSGSVLPVVVVLTLLPALFVLWFMNAAVAGDAAGARQRIVEAYRGQLRLVRSRLDGLWRMQAARLDITGEPARTFQRLIESELAEGAVLLDDGGRVIYPVTATHPGAETAAIDARLAIAAHEAPAAREADVAFIASRLNDYATALDSADRLRLMDALRPLARNTWMPTQAALHLSMDMVAAERPVAVADVIRKTSVPDVWALTSASGRVIALYRTGRIEAMMHDFLHQISPAGIVFIAYPPDVPADAEAIAAGPWLPGWQLSFVPLDRNLFDAGIRQRRTVYVSAGLAGIAVMVIGGVVGGQTLRRHLQLARLKTDLVAAVSHELRTPLASMRVLVEGLLADRELDPVKTREYLALMTVENARLSRLIENFLTFSRLERSRPRFTRRPVVPADVIADAVDAVRDRIPPGCEVRAEVEPDLPPVLADREALATALINLLENALKYTPIDKRITVRASRDDASRVLFAVSDNGIGIAAREQRRIFRRFYRVDQRLSRETTGMGLGLSIVELIMRGHDGRVTVTSEPGVGSTFTLHLPVATTGVAA